MYYFPHVANSTCFGPSNGTSNVLTIKESIPKVLKHNKCKEDKYIK